MYSAWWAACLPRGSWQGGRFEAESRTYVIYRRVMLSERRYPRCRRRDVAKTQHVPQARRSAVIKALLGREVGRIVESAEQQVVQRQVRIISRVHASRMVARVALGPLDDVTEPARRANVGVLKNPAERGEEQHDRRGLRRDADHQRESQAGERRPAHHVERAEPESAIGV